MNDETNGGPGVIPGSVIRAVAAEMRMAEVEGLHVPGYRHLADVELVGDIAARVRALKARGWE